MKRWFEQRKALIILMGIVWIVLALFFVPAYITNSIDYVQKKNETNASEGKEPIETDNRGVIIIAVDTCQQNITDVARNFEIGGPTADFTKYIESVKKFSAIYWILCVILLIAVKSDKEYEGEEHGSADWARNGEEYAVLSKKEGFVLAKDHYMPMIPNPPTGKNGNILVIGGSRKW